MAKFLFVYRGPTDEMARLSPEEIQQHMARWGEWIGRAMQEGWMKDPGDALTEEGCTVRTNVVTDGPFVESKEIVGGFSIVEAGDLAAAARLAESCPGLLVGGAVEVRRLACVMENQNR